MRILFVSDQIYPCYTGGTEVFNYYLARELAKENDVTLFTYCDRGSEGVDLFKTKHTRPARYITPIKLARYIIKNRKQIDVVFLSYSRSHWFEWSLFPVLEKLFGIKYVITIHGGGLTPWRPYVLYNWSFRNAVGLIGISERICVEYRKRTGKKVRYIPPLFPFRQSELNRGAIKDRYSIPADSKVILYVGSLKELKSPITLIKAFNELEIGFVNGENLHLVLAGDGPLRDELEGETKYKERTLFLGNVPREDIPDLYRIADLYVITSRFEGTPLSMLEAIYNRVPVIGSDAKGINAIIENERNGMLFELENHSELASGMERLLTGGELRDSCVDEAEKTYKEKYSYEKVLSAYREIFSEAAGDE